MPFCSTFHSQICGRNLHILAQPSAIPFIYLFSCAFIVSVSYRKEKYIIGATYFGIVALTILTLVYVNKEQIFQNRLTHAFPFSPDNVIDLGDTWRWVFC